MNNEEAIAILENLKTQGECLFSQRLALDLAIKALKERPQDEWIPIGERLPDRFEAVLITFQIPNREPIVYRAVYSRGMFDLDNGDVWNWNDPEIKAWMPLPEAYKEADND